MKKIGVFLPAFASLSLFLRVMHRHRTSIGGHKTLYSKNHLLIKMNGVMYPCAIAMSMAVSKALIHVSPFYFLFKEQYHGRFFQYITPVPGSETLSQGASGEEDKIGFSYA
jgi:hypothetical protein